MSYSCYRFFLLDVETETIRYFERRPRCMLRPRCFDASRQYRSWNFWTVLLCSRLEKKKKWSAVNFRRWYTRNRLFFWFFFPSKSCITRRYTAVWPAITTCAPLRLYTSTATTRVESGKWYTYTAGQMKAAWLILVEKPIDKTHHYYWTCNGLKVLGHLCMNKVSSVALRCRPDSGALYTPSNKTMGCGSRS